MPLMPPAILLELCDLLLELHHYHHRRRHLHYQTWISLSDAKDALPRPRELGLSYAYSFFALCAALFTLIV